MNFGKFEKDIKDIFEVKVGKLENLSEDDKIKYSFELNYALKKIVNSYYFEKTFDVNLIKTRIDGAAAYSLKAPDKNSRTYEITGFFANELQTHFKKNNINADAEKLTDLSVDILDELRLKDDFYNVLFETNTIKQSLFLKVKHSVDFEILEINQDTNIIKELARLNKMNNGDDFEQFNEQDFTEIMKQNGFKHFNLNNIENQKFLVIAKNQNEICGIAAIRESPVSGLNHLSYIEVANAFNGQELGKRLFTEVEKTLNEKHKILEMSPYAEIGLKHIAPLITPVIDSSDTIIDSQSAQIMQPLFKALNKYDLTDIERGQIIVEMYQQVKNKELIVENLNYTNINDYVAINVNRIQNNFDNIGIEIMPEIKQESKIKKMFNNLFR